MMGRKRRRSRRKNNIENIVEDVWRRTGKFIINVMEWDVQC